MFLEFFFFFFLFFCFLFFLSVLRKKNLLPGKHLKKVSIVKSLYRYLKVYTGFGTLCKPLPSRDPTFIMNIPLN